GNSGMRFDLLLVAADSSGDFQGNGRHRRAGEADTASSCATCSGSRSAGGESGYATVAARGRGCGRSVVTSKGWTQRRRKNLDLHFNGWEECVLELPGASRKEGCRSVRKSAAADWERGGRGNQPEWKADRAGRSEGPDSHCRADTRGLSDRAAEIAYPRSA